MFRRLRIALNAFAKPVSPPLAAEPEDLRVQIAALGERIDQMRADWQADARLAGLERLGYHISDQANLTLQQQAQMAARQLEFQRETRLLLGNMSLPPTSAWPKDGLTRQGAPADWVFGSSTICREENFRANYFPYWTAKLDFWPIYHRKLWEFVFICQVLSERGILQPGAQGLGFGVGGEQLAAYFASKGCRVTATDMAPEAAAEAGWTETAQHAAGLATLRYPTVCPDQTFDENVEFRVCDMNAIPEDLIGYDFCWSACAFEHLGSIEHGLSFVERSIDCLKPGGWAVHTTEFNLSSNDETVAAGGTVLFRRQDLEALHTRLAAKGYTMAPLDLDPGYGILDRYIDVAPYRIEPHLKLALNGYACTSVGLIVHKKA